MSSPDTAQLVDALSDAFSSQTDLEQFARFHLDIDLGEHVYLEAPRREVVRDLVDWARGEGRLGELVAEAKKVRDENLTLHAIAEQFAQDGAFLGRLRSSDDAPRWKPGEDGFALFCNRKPQWEQVKAPASHAASELVFVPGSLDQGHDYFIRRIRLWRAISPKSVVQVAPPEAYSPAESRGEMLQTMAQALRLVAPADPDELTKRIAREIARRLAKHNVVLVHPTVSLQFHNGIVRYYTDWLPEILRAAKDAGGPLKSLKCYQAIEWVDLPWIRRLSRGLGLSKPDDDSAAARQLMTAIELNAPADVLRVRQVPDLADITEDDVIDLCNRAGIGTADRETLLRKCSASTTSGRKLYVIDRLMPKFQPVGKQRLDEDLD